MLPILLAAVGVLAASTVLGAAVCALAGLEGPRGILPAIGLAVLMVAAAPLARVGSGLTVAAIAMAGMVVAALAARPVRRAIGALLSDVLPVTLLALGLLSLPWLATGHGGQLGMNVNNDTPGHLVAARWLIDHAAPFSDTLVAAGYPLGPHALSAVVSLAGIPLGDALSGVAMAAGVAVPLAALDALPTRPRAARCALALLAGTSYMLISYYAQLAFKETIEATLLLAFALVTPSVVRASTAGSRAAARAALAPAVLLAATVHTLSWPGLLWPLATLGLWGLIESGARTRALLRLVAAARPSLLSGAAILAVLIAPEAGRIVTFQGSRYAHEPAGGLGNLGRPVAPYQALGVWLNPDFRFPTRAPLLVAALLAGAVVLVLLGAWAWQRSGRRVLVAALAAGWALWVVLDLTKNGYNAAKALPVVAPLVGLALVEGAVAVWPTRWRVAAIAVLAACALSSLWVLREAVVGTDAHGRELRALAALAPPGPVLALDTSDWVNWDLYGKLIWRPPLVYTPHVVGRRPEKDYGRGQPFDLDIVSPATLNRVGSVITARNHFGSTPPAELQVVRRTRSFVLWRRVGTVPDRRVLREGWFPGARLDCKTVAGARLRRQPGWATVRAAPIVATAPGWHGSARSPGTGATRTLRLPPGRWDLALQYVSRTPLRVRAGDVDRVMPANLDRLGQLFELGATTGGQLAVTVDALRPGGLAGLLGARQRTFALDSYRHQPLGAIVATRHGDRARRVPLARACGRYLDSYTLDP